MRKIVGFLLLAGLIVGGSAEAKKNEKKSSKAKVAIDYLNSNFNTYDKLQKTIWANPELGFLETNSSGLLKQHLRENGFSLLFQSISVSFSLFCSIIFPSNIFFVPFLFL